MTATDCSKCKSPMRPVPQPVAKSPINLANLTITAYRCAACGHWNDLKRRKANRKPA